MPDPAIVTWALPQLERLLPIDEESLKQIVTYSDTLSPEAAAEHLKNLLGDSPQALEFITNFNSRRRPSPQGSPANQTQNGPSEVPRAKRGPKKKGKNIHQLPAREVENAGHVGGAYLKRDEEDYMSSGKSKPRKDNGNNKDQVHGALQLQEKTGARQQPTPQNASSSTNTRVKPPPSAAGPLISDSLPSSKNASRNASRTASPAPKAKTKVQISGGTSMHGQSSVLNDLDSAIRALEIQTNPSLSGLTPEENAKRRCNCMAKRHPLLDAAPNCMSCGKIICVKEGLGPCTFCEQPLLSAVDIQSMVRILREERGREKMSANNAAQKRADVAAPGKPRHMTGAAFLASATATPTSSSAASSESEGERKLKAAQLHRDKLLSFQANNAKRTRIFDEAADFDTPTSGTNMWASPQERALQLKRQQKILREQEWNARPEYEKRRVVASIDLAGGRIVRKMAAVERPESPVSDADVEEMEEETGPLHQPPQSRPSGGGGAFSKNPLLGGLIRPIAKVDGDESDGKGKGREREKKTLWRRVQDDNDDNEQWILDGGAYGGKTEGQVLGSEEHGNAFTSDWA
ncbi:putative c2hc5 finger protein [Neofusicoccum parvum UCRNP2]|uniref:Putative c2hc5 finger protein n=1 Tax=Botryosphaeria parva (strain UCR-NP2) TaxID=1287680 RepID=R1GL28_BOTPV|nr:putative c2hc5 finger protein [Neofusicoccum parvum UCRNP2]